MIVIIVITIIIILDPGTQFPGNEKLRYAMKKKAFIDIRLRPDIATRQRR